MKHVGSWIALSDQIKSEITDKAPLVAHAHKELVESGMDQFQAAVICPYWVNAIVDNLISKMEDEDE